MRSVDVERAGVWRGGEFVGGIARTKQGSVFTYEEAFFEQHRRLPGGVAIHLPYATRVHEIRGVNLHTYFAGLLPEGLRLQSLIAKVKTSADDLLSLLLAAGPETVGDLSVLPEGEVPPEEFEGARWKASDILFFEVFQRSLESMGMEPVVPGVQEKVSASTISFPVSNGEKAAFILKLNPPDKPRLVENEAFFMKMARECGLLAAQSRLVYDRDGNAGLLVRRFDRQWLDQERRLRKVHQEDACQFLDRYPADKYRLSCKEIAEGVAAYAAAPVPEILHLLRLFAFSYLSANGDLHGKNVSLLADGPQGGFRLAPAYDLLSTLPYGDQRMALRMDGRDDNLRRPHFLGFGARFGVREAATERMLDDLCRRASRWVPRLEEIGLTEKKTAHLRSTMEKRMRDLAAG